MVIAVLPLIPVPLTPDQRWAFKVMNTMGIATFFAILATGVSLVGFGATDDHGLPPEKQGGPVKKNAHRIFKVTLISSAATAVISMGCVAYASYVFNKTVL